MKRVVFNEFGEPSRVLHVEEVDPPVPSHGQVLVRMLASPVNPSDLMVVRGIYGKLPAVPATPGFEGVGIVESGRGLLAGLLKGKRVAVLNSETGNWCEKTTVTARQAIPLPAELPLEQAAMFFVNPATAYLMTRRVLNVPRGGWLLQTAAGSALGRMVIRLGKHFGFRTINVVRRVEQVDELKQLGGDAVLVFDAERDSGEQLRGEVMRVTGEGGVRWAIDPVGGRTASAALGCLANEGRLLVYGTLSDEPLSFSPRVLMSNGTGIEGFWLSRWMERQSVVGKIRLVRTISKLIQGGVLVSDVGESYSLDQVQQAVRKAEERGRGGKVLLRMAEA